MWTLQIQTWKKVLIDFRVTAKPINYYVVLLDGKFQNFIGKILFEVSRTFILQNHILKWGASSRWSSSLYCHKRNSDEMTIGKTHPTLVYRFGCRSKISIRTLFQIWICSVQIDFITIFRFERFYKIRNKSKAHSMLLEF